MQPQTLSFPSHTNSTLSLPSPSPSPIPQQQSPLPKTSSPPSPPPPSRCQTFYFSQNPTTSPKLLQQLQQTVLEKSALCKPHNTPGHRILPRHNNHIRIYASRTCRTKGASFRGELVSAMMASAVQWALQRSVRIEWPLWPQRR
jgi:hypothetical protein